MVIWLYMNINYLITINKNRYMINKVIIFLTRIDIFMY
jgi:hypothetical protein